MTPLTPQQLAAIQQLRNAVASVQAAAFAGGSPGYVLGADVMANLVLFYETSLGLTPTKKS